MNDKGIKGDSTDAIVNAQINLSVRKEKGIELLMRAIDGITSGNGDITPFVVAFKDGKPIVEECIVGEDGMIKLPEIKVNSKDDIAKKSKFVRRILKEITPVLHADIENVTYVALMRKDSDKLMNMLNEVRRGTKARLENRAGCIWLIVGEEEFII